MIEGLNIRCNVGPVEILRSPFLELVFRRCAVLSRATVHVPDPEGEVRSRLAVGQAVAVRWGYRGEAGMWQEWEGTVEGIDQPRRDADGADAVARRLLARTGLAVGAVEVPGEVLPWQVFSGVSVARAVKQLSHSLERSFGHDMSRHALWLGASGLTWSAGDEPGDVYSVATAENLIAHTPPQTPDGVGVVVSVPLPGLTHSRLVHIRDTRLGVDETVRALTVAHTFQGSGNSTVISYGKDTGWL